MMIVLFIFSHLKALQCPFTQMIHTDVTSLPFVLIWVARLYVTTLTSRPPVMDNS
jgi:hypothetical protein